LSNDLFTSKLINLPMAKNHQSMNLFLLSLSMFELKCTGQSETEFTGQSQTENGGHSETKYTGQSQTEFTVQSATKNDGQYVRILHSYVLLKNL
jgi:hypothetical protein